MSRVILPRGVNPGLTIHVPRGYERDQVRIGFCRVCGAKFFKGQESMWQRHVGRCARENIDRLRAQSLKVRAPVFDENNWDPEIAKHLKGVGKKMLKEGRLEMLPNERANG